MLKNLKYILFEAYHRPSAKINHIYVYTKFNVFIMCNFNLKY